MPLRRAMATGLPLLLLLAGCSGEPAEAAASLAGGSSDGLAVVELYESQGCSSCPPAIRNVNALADRKDLIALTFSVTYWDYLGWKDSFGKPAFTARQRSYAQASGWGVYTPQVVVNGAAALVGNQPGEIQTVVARSGKAARPVITNSSPAALTLAPIAGLKAPADVWLVRYDPKVRNVPIGAGENAGRTIAHRNVVVELRKLGVSDGRATRISLPPPSSPNLATALLVQLPNGGRIVAAAKL